MQGDVVSMTFQPCGEHVAPARAVACIDRTKTLSQQDIARMAAAHPDHHPRRRRYIVWRSRHVVTGCWLVSPRIDITRLGHVRWSGVMPIDPRPVHLRALDAGSVDLWRTAAVRNDNTRLPVPVVLDTKNTLLAKAAGFRALRSTRNPDDPVAGSRQRVKRR